MTCNTLLIKISIFSLALSFCFVPSIGQCALRDDKAEKKETTPHTVGSFSGATLSKNIAATSSSFTPLMKDMDKKGVIIVADNGQPPLGTDNNGKILSQTTAAETPAQTDPKKNTESKKFWKFLQNGTHTGPAPVIVSTSNSTPSQIKRSQKLMHSINATNGMPLSQANATLPMFLPPSDMPQMTPITGW